MTKPKIPWLVRLAYELELETRVPGLAQALKEKGCFDSCCEYWMNSQIDTVLNNLEKGND